MLAEAKNLISKFNRISHNKSKFQYFELDQTNKNLIADQWNTIVHNDILDNIEYFEKNNIIVYDENDMEFRIPHFESLYNELSDNVDYYRTNPDEAWIVPYIRQDLTSFLTMAFIGEEFYSNEKFQRLYSMLRHRL